MTWAAHDPLNFVDSHSMEFCNLLPRHPVVRQGADAAVLGSRYLAGLTPGHRLCRIGFGSAGASTLAVLIGRCGAIAKTRGWRRGWCSAEGAEAGPVGTSGRMVC